MLSTESERKSSQTIVPIFQIPKDKEKGKERIYGGRGDLHWITFCGGVDESR